MNKELWKPIINYEEIYEISNYGRIKGLRKGIIMSPYIMAKGYVSIKLSKGGVKKGFLVHVLVAKHFLDNHNGYPEVNHLDFNRSNNYFENLQWCTRLSNIRHSVKAGRITGFRGETAPRAKHTNDRILKIRELYATGLYTQQEIAVLFGVQRHNIAKIILRQRWAHI